VFCESFSNEVSIPNMREGDKIGMHVNVQFLNSAKHDQVQC